jgi:hypothetical protein
MQTQDHTRAMPAEFLSSETELSSGGGAKGFVWLIVGLFGLPLILGSAVGLDSPGVGVLLGALYLLALCVYTLGIMKGKRKGSCPRCATPLKIWDIENHTRNCLGCSHRIILRGGRLYAVTAANEKRAA